MTTDNYWTRALGRRVSRRVALRGAGVAGAGLAGAALIGCGDDDPAPSTPGDTPGDTPGVTATPTASDPGTSGEPQTGGIYRTSTTGDPPTLDPYGNASTGTKSFAGYVYSRLFRIDAQPGVNPQDAPIAPDVADTVETDDGATWVVRLKEGVRFQDIAPVSGRELTADDVMFSWERITAEESPHSSQVANITNVEAVDDYTLRFTHAAPSPFFQEQMADGSLLWLMPHESDGGFNPSLQAIGSGPWISEAYEVSQRLLWRKNPDYFVEGVPYMDGVDEFIIPEYANRRAQFEAGNLHVLTATSDDVPGIRTQYPDVHWEPIIGGSLNFIFFSPEDREPDAPWRDERFRRAISMAVDRDGIMEFGYNLEAIRAVGLDYPITWNNIIPAALGERWWLDPQSEAQGESRRYFQPNIDEARQLMEAVGVPSTPITYQYTDNRYGVGFSNLAEVILGMLEQTNVPFQTETQDYTSRYITQTFRGEFDGIALGVSTPFAEVSGYLERFFGDDPANHGRVRDPEITELIELQRSELDFEQRQEHIYNVQRRNGEMMFYVPVQPSGGAVWVAYHPEVQSVRRTRSYGGGTEVLAYQWLEQ